MGDQFQQCAEVSRALLQSVILITNMKEAMMESWLIDFMTHLPERFALGFQVEATRYAMGTLGVFFGLWIVLAPFIRSRRIRSKRPPVVPQVRMELINSFRTICVFVALDIIIFDMANKGVFHFYENISDMGLAYWWLSIALGILFHDTYFYWTHRAMHHAKFYKRFHLTHHRSYSPTPFTAYSFAVGEAIVEYAYVPLMLLVLPLHGSALATILLIMIFKNALGHCGYEIFPRGATRHWFWKHFTTVTHHDMHHEKGGGNFGLYFTWWDKWMGTEHANYHDRFDAVTRRTARLTVTI